MNVQSGFTIHWCKNSLVVGADEVRDEEGVDGRGGGCHGGDVDNLMLMKNMKLMID